jgi:hypothetical protein
MEPMEMKSCSGCDGSLSDRSDSSTGGKAEGVNQAKVETVGNTQVLNSGSNPERKMP